MKSTLGIQGLDLLNRLLELDPSKRISAEAGLRHPYFDDVRGQEAMVSIPVSIKFGYTNDFIESNYDFVRL